MKKVLYGTTALLAAGMFTAAANAAPASTSAVKLTIGGYMNAWMGYVNLDKKKNGNVGANQFDIGTDSIVSFNADAKLSNNLKIGAIAELVVATPVKDQEWLKDVYGYADTKFGKVEFGATDNAAKKMHHGAPDVGVFGVSESKLVNWLGVNPMVSLDSTAVNFDGNNKKISYFSPKFYGFQIGLTYVPGDKFHKAYSAANGAQRHSVENNNRGDLDAHVYRTADGEKIYGTGFTGDWAFSNAEVATIAYNNNFGGVDIGADFGFCNGKPRGVSYDMSLYDEVNPENSFHETGILGLKSQQQYSFGLDVGFSGFKIGGAYTWLTAAKTKGSFYKENSDKAFEVGASYENGPFGISANYFYSKNGGVKLSDRKVKDSNTKFQMFQLSGKYKLGAGVDAFATFGYLKFDENGRKWKKDHLGNVWTIATGLALKF